MSDCFCIIKDLAFKLSTINEYFECICECKKTELAENEELRPTDYVVSIIFIGAVCGCCFFLYRKR